MDEMIDAKKYVWTEHVTPKLDAVTIHAEDNEMERSIEESDQPQPRKISLEEAEYKQALMRQIQFGHEKKHKEQYLEIDDANVNPLLEAPENTGDSLIEIISDIDNSDLNVVIDNIVKDGTEEKIVNKLAKIGLLTQKQGVYLANVSKRFTNELESLIEHYKEEKNKAVEKLALEQQARITIEEDYKRGLHRVEKLELMLRNHDNSKDALEDKLQQSLKQIEKLENIVQTEQELRKQAELRTKEILNKAKKLKALSESEKKQKEIAESQAQKAVSRAREVMSYFFNSAFMDENTGKNAAAGFMNNNFPEFDSLMLSRKSLF